ncbi:MAG TPA: lytic murein transglycosylase, partial [Solirubrobacteraceae bacterium]|nr:lytic murein transglycosylase [Solirubrobacteraceae bacterium]
PEGAQGQPGGPPSTETTPGGEATATTTAPEVQAQSPQAMSGSGSATDHGHAHGHSHGHTHPGAGSTGGAGKGGAQPATGRAPSPSTLTPPLPGSLGTPISGVPNFFIESFGIPPFLLPIYEAAGTAYGIPWQILAAINEVETDYGRDLNVSSAGAEGWMQFLPSSWSTYGVDANGDGYEDPYNPADAIFASARYLAAAGGASSIRAAIYSYNHSAAYVESVMLRAQLLGGTPPELLSAITGLTESRFPVHAPAHFADGFSTAPGAGSHPDPEPLAGTTIDTQAGAPVIAVQDGEITAVGDSPTLGRYVSLRDAYGNTYTYAQLGSIAELYPVLEPREHTIISTRIARPGAGVGPPPSTPASAGVQPHSPLSQGAVDSGLAMGAASNLETPPAPAAAAPPPALPAPRPSASTPRVFRAGPDEVYLHALRPGVQVLAGTVLGHVAATGEGEGSSAAAGADTTAAGTPAAGTTVAGPAGSSAGGGEPHILFQIRPAGTGAPLIDPKPILDGWVRLEDTSIFRARGENPFLATSPTVGQVLLESKTQLQEQVLRDPGVRLASCERGEVRADQVDRRVLATLEFLSVSGLRPTVSAASCARAGGPAGVGNAVGSAAGDTLDISAIDGAPIAGHEAPGSIADIAVRRLLRLQGTMKPREILSAQDYPGTDNTVTLPGHRDEIQVSFEASSTAPGARKATVAGSPLTPSQWLELIARLGEIPDPIVAGGHSAAAIADPSTVAGSSAATASPANPAGGGIPSSGATNGAGGG